MWILNKLCEIIFMRKAEFSSELYWLRKYRNFSDGIDIINISCSLDFYKCDHKPSLEIVVVVLNHAIVEFELYNTLHLDKQQIVDNE